VGKGDSILVRFPKKGVMLIDAGSGGDEENFDTGRQIVAPYLWNHGIRKIDALVVTHPHEDHLGGALYILENFPVGCVIDNGIADPGNIIYKKYRDVIRNKGLRRLIVNDGDMISGFDGVKIYILNPPGEIGYVDANEGSVVMKMVYGKSSALLTGDASGDAIDRIAAHGVFARSEMLKVPHHGGSIGGASRARELFEKVSPKVCIISSGEDGSSDENVTEELRTNNFLTYETKRDGAIEAILDGKKITVTTQNKKN
jgi:competence protein ComEC